MKENTAIAEGKSLTAREAVREVRTAEQPAS